MPQLETAESSNKFDTKNKPTGMRRLMLAFANSCRALVWMAKHESAFKQELVLLVVAVIVLSVWQIPMFEKALLLCSILFVMFAEILNTAIESLTDRIGLEIHPLSGRAKDLGSAAVMLACCIAIILWLGVFVSQW